jgi:hypothetical protein
MLKHTIFFGCILFLFACTNNNDDLATRPQSAYVPVYFNPENIEATRFSPSRAIKRAGKQYVFGTLLLQNDINEGIHLIDVSNPASPKKLGFIEIPLCTEIAVKQGFLYTNNYDDLVVFDLRAPGEPKLVKRIKDVFPPVNQDYPPFFDVAFECPDPKKGVVVDWELKSNVAVKCRR